MSVRFGISYFLQDLVECDGRAASRSPPAAWRRRPPGAGCPPSASGRDPARAPPAAPSSAARRRKSSCERDPLAARHVVRLARHAARRAAQDRRPPRPAHGGSRAPGRGSRSGRWRRPSAGPARSRAAKAGTTNRSLCPGPVCGKGRATTTRSPVRRHDLERRDLRPDLAGGVGRTAARAGRPPGAGARRRRPVHLARRDDEQDRVGFRPLPRAAEGVDQPGGAGGVDRPRHADVAPRVGAGGDGGQVHHRLGAARRRPTRPRRCRRARAAPDGTAARSAGVSPGTSSGPPGRMPAHDLVAGREQRCAPATGRRTRRRR